MSKTHSDLVQAFIDAAEVALDDAKHSVDKLEKKLWEAKGDWSTDSDSAIAEISGDLIYARASYSAACVSFNTMHRVKRTVAHWEEPIEQVAHIEFPKLMESKLGRVIWFTEPGVGTLIEENGDGDKYGIGYHCDTWAQSEFTDCSPAAVYKLTNGDC